MKCPFCGYTDSKVVDSRPTDDNERIRRRRECIACQKRFTTYEVIEEMPLYVIKKDGSLEPFDRSKLLNSMLRACEKRQVSLAQIESAVGEIEQALQNSMQQQLSTREIGEMAMKKLRKIDEAAYVRFASVYRQFKDIRSFSEELQKLQSEESEE